MSRNQKTWLLWMMLIAILIVSGCIQQGGQEKTEKPQTPRSIESDVPIYSGSEVYSAPTFFYQMIGIPTEGVSVHVYYAANRDVNEILNWYKEKMKDYTLVETLPLTRVSTPQGNMEWGGILFQKDDQALGIWATGGYAVEGGKGVVYYIVTGPVEKLIGIVEEGKEKKQLPSTDQVSGEEPIERYLGSVMLEYTKDEGYPAPGSYLRITYGTADSVENVVEWYKNSLSSKGWSLGTEDKSKEATYLVFSRNGEQLYIDIYAPDEAINYVTIEISYAPNKLPSTDQVSGEEPIERYPGSVMLEHTSMTMGGVKMTTITYGSNDEPNTILNWYVNELKGNGWQIMSQSSSGEIFSITAFKEGSSITVEIEKDKYSEIVVTVYGG